MWQGLCSVLNSVAGRAFSALTFASFEVAFSALQVAEKSVLAIEKHRKSLAGKKRRKMT